MKIAAFLLLCFTLPVAAQSVEERLSKLESEVQALREENRELREELRAARASTPASPALAETSTEAATTIKVGGLVQAQAESGDALDSRFTDDNDRVFLRRARINAGGSVARDFDYRVELDLAGSLSGSSGVRAQMTDAYVTWTRHAAASLRIGQFKAPFGFEQLYSDPKLFAPERTAGSDRITLGRQTGVQLFGERGRVSYAVGAFNGNGTNVSFNDDEGFTTVGRISAKVTDGWSVGVNGFRGEETNVSVPPELGLANNTFAGTRSAWGVDTQVVAGPVELWLETLRARYDSRSLEATSAQAVWSLTKRWQAVVRWDEYADAATWLLGANYYLKGHDLKLQLHFLRGEHERHRVIARVQTIF